MAEETRSSNATSVSVAEEETYKKLPTTPAWYQYQPFEMGDIGGEPTIVAPSPFREDQSMDFGRKVDVTASGSFQTYVNGGNIVRLLQGYFVSDIVEQTTTRPLNSAGAAMSAVTTSRITLASLGDDFVAGDIIMIFGATGAASANNGRVGVVTGTPTATSVTVSGTPFVAATTGLAGAGIQRVGYQFGSGTLSMAVSGTESSLVGTGAVDFTTHRLVVGQSIYIGADATATQFGTGLSGYCRVISIAAKKLVFDNPSFTPATNAGTGKTIQVFFPSVMRNVQTEASRKRRSYQIERTMGEGQSRGTTQAQYVTGAAPSGVSLSFPLANLISANFNYMPARPEYEASAIRAGTRYPAISYTDYFNTTSDLVLGRLSEVGEALVPTDFFGLVSEFSLEQSNNVTQNKAQGIEGAAAVSYGDFTVNGSVTAYFKHVDALQAIIGNRRAKYHCYYGHNRHGFSIDLPLVSLSGGVPQFSKNNPITVSLSLSAAKSDTIGTGFGHVMMYCYFPHLPVIAEGKAS